MPPSLRTVVIVLVGVSAVALTSNQLVHSPGFINPRDFLEYWGAGAANVRGGNPYDPAELLRWQQLADPDRDGAVMMWNPPWSLAVYMPFGLLSPRWATLVWIALQIIAVMISCDWLWRVYGGPAARRCVGPVVGLSFAPVVWTVLYGQNTGLLLLGLAGFVYFRQMNRPALAGAFAALTALKPHLLAVFGVLLVLDAATRRGRIAVAVGAGVLLGGLGLALLANPAVLVQYRQAIRDPGPGAVTLDEWVLPVASYWLRVAVSAGFWVQFVPCALGCLGSAAYRFARGPRWNWTAELPWVVWVSVLTTPYGGWVFDLTVLLVPVIGAAARLAANRRWALWAMFVVGHLSVTVVSLVGEFTLPGFFWVAPVVLLLDLLASLPSASALGDDPPPPRGGKSLD